MNQVVVDVCTGVAVVAGGGIVMFAGTLFVKRVNGFFHRVNSALITLQSTGATIALMQTNSAKRIQENRIIFRALRSIIDALQTGVANGNVAEAKHDIDKYLNECID